MIKKKIYNSKTKPDPDLKKTEQSYSSIMMSFCEGVVDSGATFYFSLPVKNIS
jgi:hypothetical protein